MKTITQYINESFINESKNYNITYSKFLSIIEKTKKNLIEKAKKEGLYENFGQKEVRDLEDKYIDSSDYTAEMSKKRNALNNFDEWCMNYDGR